MTDKKPKQWITEPGINAEYENRLWDQNHTTGPRELDGCFEAGARWAEKLVAERILEALKNIFDDDKLNYSAEYRCGYFDALDEIKRIIKGE